MAIFDNPFSTTTAPEHMTSERRKRIKHNWQTAGLILLGCMITLYATPLIVYIWAHNLPLNNHTATLIYKYYQLLFSSDPFIAHERMLKDPNFVPGTLHVIPGSNDYQFRQALAYTIVALATIFLIIPRKLTNTHKRMVMKQDASIMDGAMLREMEKDKQVGIRGGQIMMLGKWQKGIRKGQPLRMIEPLSAMCLAPPGTGKTAGVIVPTIVDNDMVSMIINDSKPELWDMTGHYRSQVSYAHMINWSKTDAHEVMTDPVTKQPIKDKDGNCIFRHTIYSRFNILSKKIVPPKGPMRDTYIESGANIIIPRDAKKRSDYFPDQGREALVGMMHVIVALINDSDDPLRWEKAQLPRFWHGKEASLPMLIDWYSNSQLKSTAQAEDPEKGGEAPADPLGVWLRELCDRVDPDKHNNAPGTTLRGYGSLSTLVNMADRERSGVLGTMTQGLLPFRNTAVQERMSESDFSPDDLRGIQDPITKEWKPFSLYICVNSAEAKTFSVITSLLYETMSLFLLSYGPGEMNPNTDRALGPFPVIFIMEEFAQLEQIPAVLKGPDLGRSKKVSYLFIAQTTPQIRIIYNSEYAKQIAGTVSVTIILRQVENDTINELIARAGKTTIRRPNYSYTEGLNKDAKPFGWNRSETTEETDLLRREDITSMRAGTHMLMVQGFLTHPIKVDTPLFFKDKVMSSKVHSRGVGPLPQYCVPKGLHDARVAEWEEANKNHKELVKARSSASHDAGKMTTEDAISEQIRDEDYANMFAAGQSRPPLTWWPESSVSVSSCALFIYQRASLSPDVSLSFPLF